MDLQHPGQQPSEGLKQVLFHLNFYPGGRLVNHTIAYLRLVHPVQRLCEFLHAQRQVLVRLRVELLVLLKNKNQNPQYMYMQLDKDI